MLSDNRHEWHAEDGNQHSKPGSTYISTGETGTPEHTSSHSNSEYMNVLGIR
jgi:hypothetical protein